MPKARDIPGKLCPTLTERNHRWLVKCAAWALTKWVASWDHQVPWLVRWFTDGSWWLINGEVVLIYWLSYGLLMTVNCCFFWWVDDVYRSQLMATWWLQLTMVMNNDAGGMVRTRQVWHSLMMNNRKWRFIITIHQKDHSPSLSYNIIHHYSNNLIIGW